MLNVSSEEVQVYFSNIVGMPKVPGSARDSVSFQAHPPWLREAKENF